MRIARKVAADLWSARGRAALVVVAMATGLFAVTMVGVTRALLGRELRRSFAAIVPASATIRTAPAPDSVLAAVARVPGVRLVDGARTLGASTRVGDRRTPVLLLAAADYGRVAIDRLRPESGAWPPAPGTVLLERAAVRVARVRPGDSLAVAVGSRAPVPLAFAGTVHDFSQAPAWQEGVIYGYVSRATMARLAGTGDGLTDIRIVVAERPLDAAHIREVTGRAAREVERLGVRVREIQVPPPGEHPHQGQMDALLGIQQTFGAAALLLSGALVVVLLNALLAQHRRQIGAMKAIGAARGALVRMYALWVLALAGCALAAALPAGVVAGRAYARFIAEMLNFDVASDAVPAPLLLALVALGGLLPMLVALRPILRAAGMTTRAALSDAPPDAVARVPHVAARLPRTEAGRLAALGVGNAMRARGRFALVVATLALGGALFLAALNLGASFRATLAATVARLGYDVQLDVTDGTPAAALEAALRALPGAARVESRPATSAVSLTPGDDPGRFALAGGHAEAMPPALTLVAGRWLAAADGRAVVANHVWLARHPGHAVGDSVALRVGGETAWWRIVGAVREVMAGPALYAPAARVEAAARGGPLTRSVRIVARDHSPAAVRAVAAASERALAARGIPVARLTDLRETQQHRDDHVVMIVAFLVAMAGLSMAVGGLGLATMLGVSVVERSRELGVMRAIGATRRQLLALVVVEGAWIAAAGYAAGAVLAVPATWALDAAFGRMMLGMPLELRLSAAALPALAVVGGAVALLASGVPAWRASTLAPRELLSAV